QQAGRRPQDRGLASAVGPDEAQPPPGGRPAADAVQHLGLVQGDAEVVDRQATHVSTAPVPRSTQMNAGAPTSAVTTPMGSSEGASTVRARVSASTRKPAPPSRDSGSTIR